MNKKLKIEEVRKNFAQLISKLEQNGGSVEIVKNKHTAAVIINFEDYQKLLIQSGTQLTRKKTNAKWKLKGSIGIVEDFEESAKDVSKSILNSISKNKL